MTLKNCVTHFSGLLCLPFRGPFGLFCFVYGDRVSLSGLELRDTLASASQVLGLQTCAITSSFVYVLQCVYYVYVHICVHLYG